MDRLKNIILKCVASALSCSVVFSLGVTKNFLSDVRAEEGSHSEEKSKTENLIIVKTMEDFLNLKNCSLGVDNDKNCRTTVILENDIYITSDGTPTGGPVEYEEIEKIDCELDGDGHAIFFNVQNKEDFSIFNECAESSIINNLKLSGKIKCKNFYGVAKTSHLITNVDANWDVSADGNCAGLVNVNHGVIEQCKVEGNMVFNGSFGGIALKEQCFHFYSIKIIKCTVSVSAFLNDSSPTDESQTRLVGGIISENLNIVRNCSAENLDIRLPDTDNVLCGGIAGVNKFKILDCGFSGSIKGGVSGGIVAKNDCEICDPLVLFCRSSGEIDSIVAGGICAINTCSGFEDINFKSGISFKCSSNGTVIGKKVSGAIVAEYTCDNDKNSFMDCCSKDCKLVGTQSLKVRGTNCDVDFDLNLSNLKFDGFDFQKVKDSCYIYKHKKTGALVGISADVENKWMYYSPIFENDFQIRVQSIDVKNNNGTTHALEHIMCSKMLNSNRTFEHGLQFAQVGNNGAFFSLKYSASLFKFGMDPNDTVINCLHAVFDSDFQIDCDDFKREVYHCLLVNGKKHERGRVYLEELVNQNRPLCMLKKYVTPPFPGCFEAAGLPELVKTISIEEMKSEYKRLFHPSKASIEINAVVFDYKSIMEQINSIFNNFDDINLDDVSDDLIGSSVSQPIFAAEECIRKEVFLENNNEYKYRCCIAFESYVDKNKLKTLSKINIGSVAKLKKESIYYFQRPKKLISFWSDEKEDFDIEALKSRIFDFCTKSCIDVPIFIVVLENHSNNVEPKDEELNPVIIFHANYRPYEDHVEIILNYIILEQIYDFKNVIQEFIQYNIGSKLKSEGRIYDLCVEITDYTVDLKFEGSISDDVIEFFKPDDSGKSDFTRTLEESLPKDPDLNRCILSFIEYVSHRAGMAYLSQ